MAVTTTYTTLQANVADWLSRADLTSQIPVFIQNWETDFYSDPENWGSWMESALSVVLSGNVAALPTDYLGLRIAYFSGYRELKRVSLEQLYERYSRGSVNASAGIAKFIARNGSNFEFGPAIQSGTLIGTYYAKPTAIRSASADAASHFLITDFPNLCLYGSLLQAKGLSQDDAKVMLWKAAFDEASDTYRRRMRAEHNSGSTPFTVVC